MHPSSKNCIFNSGLSIKDFNKTDGSDEKDHENDFDFGLNTPLPDIITHEQQLSIVNEDDSKE